MLSVKVYMDLGPLQRLQTALDQAPFRRALYECAKLYRDAMFARFVAGDNWPPLAPETVRRKGHATILVDTGTLRDATAEHVEDTAEGIIIGYGPRAHPKFQGTIGELAAIHQAGNERLPARLILVDPPPELLAEMVELCREALQEIGDG